MEDVIEESSSGLDFVEALANCVHDIKNSAGVVINAAESIQHTISNVDVAPELTGLQTEARRINHDLIHLLSLYKMDHSKQGICPAIVDCEDLLEELAAYNKPLLEMRGLHFEMDAHESVEGYFDREHVLGILNSVINNAQRFAHATVRVACNVDDGYIVLSVEDDGDGYPEEMLTRQKIDPGSTSYSAGSTGLGLFFASRIAELHRHRDRIGRVTLSNDGIEGGAALNCGYRRLAAAQDSCGPLKQRLRPAFLAA